MTALLPQQEQFAARLASKTGLDRNVVRGWMLAEESGSAARQRAAQGNYNWLNVGYFDSGAGGLTKDKEWGDPVSAADQTALFLEGKKYGASSGIRSILTTAGMHAGDQIEAIAKSGWASSGYANGAHLVSAYHLVSGLPAPDFSMPETPKGQAPPKTAEASSQTRQNGHETLDTQTGPATFLKGASIALPNLDSSGKVSDILPTSTLRGSSIPLPALDTAPATKSPLTRGQPSPNPLTLKAPESSSTGGAILATAGAQVGTPYVWGGDTPKGFDCSGLVYWAAKQHGVTLPRTTYGQVKAGVAVPNVKSLQPGDLVFFGSDHHHEAIYAGNGKMLEAPHTGEAVRVVPLRTADISAMRRL